MTSLTLPPQRRAIQAKSEGQEDRVALWDLSREHPHQPAGTVPCFCQKTRGVAVSDMPGSDRSNWVASSTVR